MFRRLVAAAVLVIVAAVLLILAWPQIFGLQRTEGIVEVVAFRAALAILAAVAVVLALVLAGASRAFRRFALSLAALFLVFVLINAAVLNSRGFGDTTFAAKKPGDLTVVSWNTLGGATGAQSIAQLALVANADIVSLPETTEITARQVASLMKDGGTTMSVHTVSFGLVAKSRSTSILISTKLGGYHIDSKVGNTKAVPTVVMVPDSGSGPTIVAAHPVAPTESQLDNWRSGLTFLAALCGAKNMIIAGDFNSTLDHQAGLATSQGTALGTCSDAALATDNAAVGTWPTKVPALLGATIDHVMATSNWRFTGFRVIQNLDDAGSDHRPIVAQLSPRR